MCQTRTNDVPPSLVSACPARTVSMINSGPNEITTEQATFDRRQVTGSSFVTSTTCPLTTITQISNEKSTRHEISNRQRIKKETKMYEKIEFSLNVFWEGPAEGTVGSLVFRGTQTIYFHFKWGYEEIDKSKVLKSIK